MLALTMAFAQINNHIEILRAYHSMERHSVGRDGKCLRKRLNGDNKLEIKAREGLWDKGAPASTLPIVALNTNRVLIDSGFLYAVYNSWNKAATTEEKDCVISELAGVIIHEASHTCLGIEKYAYLIEYYYKWRFRHDYHATCPMCVPAVSGSMRLSYRRRLKCRVSIRRKSGIGICPVSPTPAGFRKGKVIVSPAYSCRNPKRGICCNRV